MGLEFTLAIYMYQRGTHTGNVITTAMDIHMDYSKYGKDCVNLIFTCFSFCVKPRTQKLKFAMISGATLSV